jgi:CRP-like cAMP-binding protein
MLQQRLELLSYSGIAQKAAFYLLIKSRQSGKNVVRIPGTVTSWAMSMNVSRPSLHRELRKLEAEGIISYTPPIIKINDFEALMEVLG